MDDEEERFREVLGPLFDEMSSDYETSVSINDLLTSDEFDRIGSTTYLMQMPVQGTTAIDLATSIDHWTDTRCEECGNFLHLFAMQFTINLWNTIFIDLENDNE